MRKVEEDRAHAILRCIYCNVCKQLDENFKLVSCFLWPKGFTQAPVEDKAIDAPRWPDTGAGLTARIENGVVKLAWARAVGDIAGYDVFRAEEDGTATIVEAVKGTKFADRLAVGGLGYTYHVMAYDACGRHTPPSNIVRAEPAIPTFEEAASAND